MKRTMLIGAAMAVAWTAGAYAKATRITFDNFCDGMKITGHGMQFVSTQTGKCLGGTLVMGAGYKAGTKRAGQVVLGVNWEAFDGQPAGSEQYSYILQYPFVTGGTWQETFTKDGTTFTVLNTGTYSLVGSPVKGPTGARPTIEPAN